MINLPRAGWFRAAADRAGLRGRGQGSAGRPTAQRRGLDADPGRRILSVAGPRQGGERSVFPWIGRAGSDACVFGSGLVVRIY